jgi:hypothetical protein
VFAHGFLRDVRIAGGGVRLRGLDRSPWWFPAMR